MFHCQSGDASFVAAGCGRYIKSDEPMELLPVVSPASGCSNLYLEGFSQLLSNIPYQS